MGGRTGPGIGNGFGASVRTDRGGNSGNPTGRQYFLSIRPDDCFSGACMLKSVRQEDYEVLLVT